MSEAPVSASSATTVIAAPAVARDEESLYAEFESGGRPGLAARAWLDAVREELARRHLAGAGGMEIVREYTGCVDRMVRALYRYADHHHSRRFSRLNQRLAVIARGGYGRGELNPQSDIDLLFLHDYKPGPYAEVVTEIILHALWDAGLTVGQAVRNVRECVRAANDDLKEKTAILDIRFLAGDEKLWAALDKALIDDVLNRNQQQFFQAKLEESRDRHRHYGDSIYLLEPQIKEGEGGLRDLHTALWLAKVKYKVHSLPELVQKAIISEPELKEVVRARGLSVPRAQFAAFPERAASRSAHVRVPGADRSDARLYHARRDSGSASSALMRFYYAQAAAIHRFSEGLIARVTEDPAAGRFMRRTGGRQIRPGVLIQGHLLGIAEQGLLHSRADQSHHDLRRLPGARRGAFGQRLSAGARQPGADRRRFSMRPADRDGADGNYVGAPARGRDAWRRCIARACWAR